MKTFLCLATLLFGASVTVGQDVRPAGVPPGAVQAGQAEAKAERDLPPPIQAKRSLDISKLQRQADELAKLAQTIPPDIESVRTGMLPKDTAQKLKQIEKLSKQLRSSLNL